MCTNFYELYIIRYFDIFAAESVQSKKPSVGRRPYISPMPWGWLRMMRCVIITIMGRKLKYILEKAEKDGRLTKEEIVFILELRQKIKSMPCSTQPVRWDTSILVITFFYMGFYILALIVVIIAAFVITGYLTGILAVTGKKKPKSLKLPLI